MSNPWSPFSLGSSPWTSIGEGAAWWSDGGTLIFTGTDEIDFENSVDAPVLFAGPASAENPWVDV